MTPTIAAGSEFRSFLVGRPAEFQRGTVHLDQSAMNEVSRRLANEILPAQSRQRAVLIDERATSRREPSTRLALCRAVTVAIELRVGRVVGSLATPWVRLGDLPGALVTGGHAHRRHRGVGIARQVSPRERRNEDSRDSCGGNETFARFGECE